MLSQKDLYKLGQIGVTIFKSRVIVQDSENPGIHLYEFEQDEIAHLTIAATNERDYSKTQRFGIFRASIRLEAPRVYRFCIELRNGEKKYTHMTDIDLIGVSKAVTKLNKIIQHES